MGCGGGVYSKLGANEGNATDRPKGGKKCSQARGNRDPKTAGEVQGRKNTWMWQVQKPTKAPDDQGKSHALGQSGTVTFGVEQIK